MGQLIQIHHLALMLVFEVIEPIAALSIPRLLQVVEEGVIGGVPIPLLLHRDHLLVLDVENAVAVLLRLLDLFEDSTNYYVALELLEDGNLLEALARIT